MPAILDQGLKRIIKEIQNLVSFVCYEAIHLRKTMSKKEMERLMGDMFLVSNKANQINHAAFFCSGEGRFVKCFKQNDSGELCLIPELTMQEPNRVFQVKSNIDDGDSNGVITLAMLRRKSYRSPNNVSEANLLLSAKTVMKNCKIAHSHGRKFLDAEGKFRSGCNLNDYLVFVLDAMYVEELKCLARNTESATERDEILTQERKPGWVFTGYMAFVMFGPFAIDPIFRSNNILNGTSINLVFCFDTLCILRRFTFILLLLDEDHETFTRREQREMEKENVDEKLTMFKTITGKRNVVTQESTDAKVNWEEAKLAQRNVEQKNMLLVQLQSSKAQRLTALMSMNSNLSTLPQFGPSHCMYARYELNLKKIDELLTDMDTIDEKVETAYDDRDQNCMKRLKMENVDEGKVYETPHISALKDDNDNVDIEYDANAENKNGEIGTCAI